MGPFGLSVDAQTDWVLFPFRVEPILRIRGKTERPSENNDDEPWPLSALGGLPDPLRHISSADQEENIKAACRRHSCVERLGIESCYDWIPAFKFIYQSQVVGL